MGRNIENFFANFERKVKFSNRKNEVKGIGIHNKIKHEDENLEEQAIGKMGNTGDSISQALKEENREKAVQILEEFKEKFGAVESVQSFIVGQEAIIESAKGKKGGVGEEKEEEEEEDVKGAKVGKEKENISEAKKAGEGEKGVEEEVISGQSLGALQSDEKGKEEGVKEEGEKEEKVEGGIEEDKGGKEKREIENIEQEMIAEEEKFNQILLTGDMDLSDDFLLKFWKKYKPYKDKRKEYNDRMDDRLGTINEFLWRAKSLPVENKIDKMVFLKLLLNGQDDELRSSPIFKRMIEEYPNFNLVDDPLIKAATKKVIKKYVDELVQNVREGYEGWLPDIKKQVKSGRRKKESYEKLINDEIAACHLSGEIELADWLRAESAMGEEKSDPLKEGGGIEKTGEGEKMVELPENLREKLPLVKYEIMGNREALREFLDKWEKAWEEGGSGIGYLNFLNKLKAELEKKKYLYDFVDDKIRKFYETDPKNEIIKILDSELDSGGLSKETVAKIERKFNYKPEIIKEFLEILDQAKNEAIKQESQETSKENLAESGAQKEVASTTATEKGRRDSKEEVAEGTNREFGQENREGSKSSEEQQKRIERIVAAVLEESRGAGSPEEAIRILNEFIANELNNIGDLGVKEEVETKIDVEYEKYGLGKINGGKIASQLSKSLEKIGDDNLKVINFLKEEKVKHENDPTFRGRVVMDFIDSRKKKIEKGILENLTKEVNSYIGENNFAGTGKILNDTEEFLKNGGILSEESRVVISELDSRIEEGINKSAEKIINELDTEDSGGGWEKIIKLKTFLDCEGFNNLDVFVHRVVEEKINERLKELHARLQIETTGALLNLKDEWESGALVGSEYLRQLQEAKKSWDDGKEYGISALFDEPLNELSQDNCLADIHNSFDEALKDNDFEKARYVKDKLKRKYDQDLYAGDIEHGIVVYFEQKLDDVEKKIMRIGILNESGDPRDKDELDNLVEEKKRLKEGFEEFCFDEIKSGVEIQDLKQEAGGWGNENKDMKKIVEEVENKLKFMDPEEVKKRFGDELEAMIIDDRTKRGDIAKMGELLGLKIDISSKKWTEEQKVLAKVTEILKGAQEWAKIEEYSEKQQTTPKSKKQKIWDLTKETFGGLVKGAAAFKVAGAGLAFAGGTPIGLAGVGATFLTAGGAMVGWRYIEGFLREKSKKREVNKINLDYSQVDVREKLMNNMASLISMEQADKVNPIKKKREKEEKKIIKEYAQIDDDKKAEEYLNNIRDGKNKKKGVFQEIFSEPILKESKEKKEQEAAISMAALSTAKFRTDAKAARFMHKMVENNPNLKEKFSKEDKLSKIGRFAKGAGIEYVKELGGFAVYELIPFFKVGAVVGMAKKGAELPDIVFSNRDFYERNKKIKKAMKIGCGIASGLAFAALMAPRTAEGGILKGWVEGVKEDAGILGSLGKGKYGIGAAAGKIATGFKARHGIKESKPAEQLAQEQEIDNRFWEEMNKIENDISTDEKDIGMMKILLKNIKGEDGKVRDLSMEDKVAFLDKVSKSTMDARDETWERWGKLDNELNNKVLSDSKQFTPEELKAEAEWRLDKRIRRLDGDDRGTSVKDMQEYLKESTSERLVKEIKQEIAAELELAKKGEAVKKVETVEKVGKVETVKTAEGVKSTGVENIKVEKGDTVWKIAKEMETKLGIQRPNAPSELKGEALARWQEAQDTYFNDAIKDEIAKQMRAKGLNPHNIKEGQELLIDKAEIKFGLERRGIVEKAGKLTTGDVDNILKNNAQNAKVAKFKKVRGGATVPRVGVETATGRELTNGELGALELIETMENIGFKTLNPKQRELLAKVMNAEGIKEEDDYKGVEKFYKESIVKEIEGIFNDPKIPNKEVAIKDVVAKSMEKLKTTEIEIGKGEEVKTGEKVENDIREIEGRLKEAGFNELKQEQMELLSKVINENGVEAGEIAAAVEKSGEIISKLNNRSIDQEAAIRELLKKTTKELKSAEIAHIKKSKDIIREVANKTSEETNYDSIDYAKEKNLVNEMKGKKIVDKKLPAENTLENLETKKFDFTGEPIKVEGDTILAQENHFTKEIGKNNVPYITKNGILIPEMATAVEGLTNAGYKIGGEITEQKMGNVLKLLLAKPELNTLEKVSLAKFHLAPENPVNARSFATMSGYPPLAGEKIIPVVDKNGAVTMPLYNKAENRHFTVHYDTGNGKFFWKNVFGFRKYFNSAADLMTVLTRQYRRQTGRFYKR